MSGGWQVGAQLGPYFGDTAAQEYLPPSGVSEVSSALPCSPLSWSALRDIRLMGKEATTQPLGSAGDPGERR